MNLVPLWLLQVTKAILGSCAWGSDAAERLAFVSLLNKSEIFGAEMTEICQVLDMRVEVRTTDVIFIDTLPTQVPL